MARKTKKTKGIIATIKPNVWPYDVLLCVESTIEEIVQHIEVKKQYKLSDKERDLFQARHFRQGRTLQLQNNAIVLWLRHKPVSPYTIAVLAHEAFHATDFILDNAGLKLTNESDEAYAYLLDFIVREALYVCSKK